MNYGYAEILDYLSSSHKMDLDLAVAYDMPYVIEKTKIQANPTVLAMMIIDFALNYERSIESNISKTLLTGMDEDLLTSRICGIPTSIIVKRLGTYAGRKLFSKVDIPYDITEEDKETIKRIVIMFKTSLKAKDPMNMLASGLMFLKRECGIDLNPDEPKQHF